MGFKKKGGGNIKKYRVPEEKGESPLYNKMGMIPIREKFNDITLNFVDLIKSTFLLVAMSLSAENYEKISKVFFMLYFMFQKYNIKNTGSF